MSEFTERFANHAVHATLQTLDSALAEIESSDLSDISAIERIDRVRQVQRLATTRFAAIDPALVPQDRLDAVNNSVKEQTTQIAEYKTDQDVAHLTNASNMCDQILNQLGPIPIATTPEDVEGLREAMISFRRSLGQHARHVETDYEKLEKEFEDIGTRFVELTTEITSQKGRLDTAISTFQEQFSEAESRRGEQYATESKNTRDELNRILESTKQDVTNITADFRQQFKEAESERKTQYTTESKSTRDELNRILETGKQEFSEIAREHKQAFATLANEAKESRIAMESEFTKKVDDYLALLEQRKEEAEKLVHVIGNTGMVGGYQQVANEERRSSRLWNVITGVLIAGFIGFAIFAFETIATGDFKLGAFGAKAFVAVAFGVGLAWAARQAEKHQETERRSRRMELELASISPFLALLPEPVQVEIRRDLANRFFGQPEQTSGEKRDKTTGSLLDVVNMLVKTIGELAAKK